MFEALSPRFLMCWSVLVLLAACDDGEAPCDPGEEIECSCEDGSEGTGRAHRPRGLSRPRSRRRPAAVRLGGLQLEQLPITGRCDVTPCRLVHIDVAAREVRAELKLRRPLRDVIALRAVPDQKMLIVALSPPGRDAFSTPTLDGGYQVVRFDLPGDE